MTLQRSTIQELYQITIPEIHFIQQILPHILLWTVWFWICDNQFSAWCKNSNKLIHDFLLDLWAFIRAYLAILSKEEFEDTKGVIRNRISKKNKQHNGQKKKTQKDKQRSTKHTYKTKDRVTRTPLKAGGELRCSGKVNSWR